MAQKKTLLEIYQDAEKLREKNAIEYAAANKLYLAVKEYQMGQPTVSFELHQGLQATEAELKKHINKLKKKI